MTNRAPTPSQPGSNLEDPVALLREAAQLLREAVVAATAGPWTTRLGDYVVVEGPDGWRDAAVVPLPEPYPDQPIWDAGFDTVSADCPDVCIDGRSLSPAQARVYAAALLAAADEVDRQLAEGCAATHEIERQGGDQP